MTAEQEESLARSRQELGAAGVLVKEGFGAQAISRAYFRRLSRGVCVSGIGAGRSPLSDTAWPSDASCSRKPAMRNAEGPMSTPRRPAPKSRGTPMM